MHGFYSVCHSSHGFILVYLYLPSPQNTLKGGVCSYFLGSPPSIFHRMLSNALFVLFNLFSPLLLSGANLAFRRRAEELQTIKVRFLFAFTIRVVL